MNYEAIMVLGCGISAAIGIYGLLTDALDNGMRWRLGPLALSAYRIEPKSETGLRRESGLTIHVQFGGRFVRQPVPTPATTPAQPWACWRE